MGLRLGVQLPEFLHRHVLLGSGELRRQRHIELILQDRFRLLGRGMRDHHLVEGALHVEHHGVEAAPGRCVDSGHRPRSVVEFANAERLCQPAGGIDRQHGYLAASLGCPNARLRPTWSSYRRLRSRSR